MQQQQGRSSYDSSQQSAAEVRRSEVAVSTHTDLYQDTGSIRLKFHSTPSVNNDNTLPYGRTKLSIEL